MSKSDIGNGVNERELRLLQLLYSGYEDARAARALGLSHRTVQRDVRGLMLKVGVNSRLALGARAQELGWLDRTRGSGEDRRTGAPWEQGVAGQDAA
ncbi:MULTISPECIES: LuxR C-terminal-related transcriptional regulator [unclassified Streptomyces]|uniref:LuxR C-terminal-related transcriptional regulator n=1 Tax=unclassified Streptomyces TaxID=2593676 RepID=UPI001369CBCC|nr:LuxR C-terminal-related transcriptional regulator [Streptomyces sp. SID2563]MYW08901.1 DNA-binding response regulator [Streptomyces sp. SID2563]